MTIGGGDGGTASIAPVTPEPRTAVPHDAVREGAEPAGATNHAPPLHPVLATVCVAVVGYVVLAASTVGFGLLLTRELLHGLIGEWDVDVTTWLVERRSPTRNDLSLVGSYLSETVTVLVVLVLVVGALALTRHWRELGLVAVAMAVEAATYGTATFFVERHRPMVPRLEELVVADSYFSGHVAAATALYGSLAVVTWSLTRRAVLRGLVVALAIVAPLVVALSRMYRGMHYASDVTVAVLVGLGCIVVAVLAVRAGTEAAAARRAAHAVHAVERTR